MPGEKGQVPTFGLTVCEFQTFQPSRTASREALRLFVTAIAKKRKRWTSLDTAVGFCTLTDLMGHRSSLYGREAAAIGELSIQRAFALDRQKDPDD